MSTPTACQPLKYRRKSFCNKKIKKSSRCWEYDAAGRLVQEKFDHYDNDFDQTSQWEYDLVGNRLLQKVDKGNDNIWDAITTYFYDANDRLLKEIFDDLTFANKDRVTTYGYDKTQQTGKVVTENGVLVSTTTFEYDAQGRMAVVTITTGNRVEKTTYGGSIPVSFTVFAL